MTSTATERLQGQALKEHYARHKDGDVQEMIESAGYLDAECFVSMLHRADGDWPLPISKDPEEGAEWRSSNSQLSWTAPLDISLHRNNNPDVADSIAKVVSYLRDGYKKTFT